ncbi:MAG TPA: hypothetical protein VKP65_13840, partial [Rhodothermales bacterium]|nr:hypothetical protein [Rhodothermales bacterium]
FGWATPALMALFTHTVERRTGQAMRGVGPVLVLVLVLALLAYPPFLLWGYAPAVLGTARLPLSVMAAGFNVLGWYAFAIVYARATRGVQRDAVLWICDLALFFLVFSTLGAWGLPITQALGVGTEPLKAALTHVFLDTFGEGWFVLGVLGLAYAAAAETRRPVARWPVLVAALGIPFTFALALPAGFVPPLWTWLARFGGVAVAAGLLAAVVVLWRRLQGHRVGWLWHIALTLLALKAAGQFVVAVVPGMDWASLHGLRILYLHLMLIGFVTLGLFAAAEAAFEVIGSVGLKAMVVAVAVLLATLVPLTGLWPTALSGTWVLYAAAIAACLPVLVGMFVLGRLLLGPFDKKRAL